MDYSSEHQIYQDHVLTHYEDPFHFGRLDNHTHSHEEKNSLCGDIVRLELSIDKDRIVDTYFSGKGCVISIAATSMLLEEMMDKAAKEVMDYSAAQMLDLFQAKLTPKRQQCCLLGWKALQQAIHAPVSTEP